jgi:hypothetical protein
MTKTVSKTYKMQSIEGVIDQLRSSQPENIAERTAAERLRPAIADRVKQGWTEGEIHDVLSRSAIDLDIETVGKIVREERRRLRQRAATKAAKKATKLSPSGATAA